MAQQFTPFAEFIFDLVKVNEHFAESVLTSAKEKNDRTPQGSQSLMQSIVFYKDDTKTLEKGFLDLSYTLNAPSLLDLFFQKDFTNSLFSDRNHIRNALNSLDSKNPPVGFDVIYSNMESYFSKLNAPDFLTFLEQSASQMREKKGVLKAVLEEQKEAFFNFVIENFTNEFSKESTFPLLPEEPVNLFINEAAGIQAAQSPAEKDICETAVCKMLACLLLLQVSKGKTGEGDSQKLFKMLWNYHDSVAPVWEGAEQLLPAEDGNILFGDFSFCPALFQGLTNDKKEPRTLIEELPLSSSLVIIGDGGSGKTFFAKKLLSILKNSSQGNAIECAGDKKIKIKPGSTFGTAIYFKLKELQEELSPSFCKRIYEYRHAFFPKFSSAKEDTPLFTSESQRNWLAYFINEIYQKKIVIILDGFNEISPANRKNLIAEIEALNKAIRKESCRPCFIITTRPGYEEAFSKFSGKQVFLLRLSSDSISDYLRSYSNLYTYRLNLGPQRQEKLDQLLSSPLLLEFFVRTYKEDSPDKIPAGLNRCLIFDDACRRFLDNLDDDLKPYGRFCYKLLLPDMLADAKYGEFSFSMGKTSFFIQNWVLNLGDNRNNNFLREFDFTEISYDDKFTRKSHFCEVLTSLLDYLALGQDYMHEMVFDFFRAKAILNECLYDDSNYSGLLFIQSKLHNLIELSLGYNVDTALENLQTSLMLAEMGEEKVSSDSSAEPEALYTHFSTEYKMHWPEYLFAVVNFIDTLREDSTLLLKYFFMLKPISENKDGKQSYILQQIEKYLQDAYNDESALYHKGVLYNSLAYILNRMLNKKELETVFSEELANLGFSDITSFKNAVVLSLLDTAQSCAGAYSKKIDEISSGRHETDMAHLLEAKIQNNYGAYYLRRYQTETNPQQKEILSRQLDKYRAEALSIKEACEQKYLQSFGKSPDCVSLGEDCAKCKKYKDANNGLSESIPACKDYRAILISLNDSFIAMGIDHFYKAKWFAESGDYEKAFCEYQTAIAKHREGEEYYKRASGETAVPLVNRVRSIGCQIRQQLLLTFTDFNKDNTLQADQSIFDVINALKELLNNDQIKHGVEREAYKHNIFALSPFIFARKEVSSAYTELLSAYESLYEEFFSGRENPLPLKTEIIIAAYESLLQEAEALIDEGDFDAALQKYEQIINNLKPLTEAAAGSRDSNALLFSIKQKIFHCQTKQVALWENLNTEKEQFNVALTAINAHKNFEDVFKNRNLLPDKYTEYIENDFWALSSELHHLVDKNILDSAENSFLPRYNRCKELYRTYFDDTGTHFEELLEDFLKEKKY